MVNLDAETGQVSTLMDGTYLTRLRTGAIAGAATDVLARKDSKIFALFGTGGQAETQLEAVLNVREIELVKVFDISKERAQAFVDKMSKRFKGVFNARLVVAASSNEAIQDADIITSVTTARVATFDGTLVKPGCHINGVGSYTPEMAEINEYTASVTEYGIPFSSSLRKGNFMGCQFHPEKSGDDGEKILSNFLKMKL